MEPEQPTLIFTERHPQLSVFSFIRDGDDDGGGDDGDDDGCGDGGDGGGDQNIHPLSSFSFILMVMSQ